MKLWLFFMLAGVLLIAPMAGPVLAECLMDYDGYTVCRETPPNMPQALREKTCRENGGRMVGECPLPDTGYCEVGQPGGLHLYMWGGPVNATTCEGVWHGPGSAGPGSGQTGAGAETGSTGSGGLVAADESSPEPEDDSVDAGQGAGLADPIWAIVPLRPGDRIMREIAVGPVTTAMVASDDSLAEVFDYYEQALAAKGWSMGSRYAEANEGVLIMFKGETRLSFAAAEKDGEENTAGLQYAVQLHGPAQ